MTNREISTRDAPAPFSHYSQAIEIEPGKRIVQISGQIGAYPDGTLAPPGSSTKSPGGTCLQYSLPPE